MHLGITGLISYENFSRKRRFSMRFPRKPQNFRRTTCQPRARKSRGSPTRMDLAREIAHGAMLVERIMEFTCRIIIDSAMSRARLVSQSRGLLIGAAPRIIRRSNIARSMRGMLQLAHVTACARRCRTDPRRN